MARVIPVCVVVLALCALTVFAASDGEAVVVRSLDQGGTAPQVHLQVEDDDDDFAWLFKTNRAEMTNVPIYFSKALPPWLKGILVRNSLGMYENGGRSFVHAFDAFGKLASWQFFGNGSAVFSTHFLKSNFYNDSMASESIAPYLLLDSVSPPFDFYEKLKSFVRGMDNMNVNVYEFTNSRTREKEYAALSDFWIVYNISILSLSTVSRVTPEITSGSKNHLQGLADHGFHSLLSSAHPLPEFGKNNHLTFISSLAIVPWQSNKISFMRIMSLDRREIITEIPVDRVPYMHSFSVTQTKAILLASPYYLVIMCMVRYAVPATCLKWYADLPSTLYVVNLKNQTVDRMQVPSVFTLHHINAYDDSNGNVVMDVSAYPNPEVLECTKVDQLRNPVKRNQCDMRATVKRITIDMTTKTAVMADVDQRPTPGIASTLDMSVINEAYRSQRYCYVYGVAVKIDNVTISKTAIVKKDLCHNGKGDRVWYVPRQFPGEPWFVARPGAVEEDDGILLVPVLKGAGHKSHLVMLDTKDLYLINEAQMPTRAPYSPHGRFFHF